MQRQVAKAIEPTDSDWAFSTGVVELRDDPILYTHSPRLSQTADVLGDVMFKDSPKRKVLCLCGAIADIDSAIASTKKRLGKSVECRSCRNERIAQEMEELRSHFDGEEWKNED